MVSWVKSKHNSVGSVSYQLAKQPALSFNNSDFFSHASFDLIHFDIWGPSPIATVGGFKYFVIFVDDFSRYTWVYLMHNRSELAQIYYTFVRMISTHFSKAINTHKTPLFSIPVQQHLSKMVGLNTNTATYLTLLGLSSFLAHVLNVF